MSPAWRDTVFICYAQREAAQRGTGWLPHGSRLTFTISFALCSRHQQGGRPITEDSRASRHDSWLVLPYAFRRGSTLCRRNTAGDLNSVAGFARPQTVHSYPSPNRHESLPSSFTTFVRSRANFPQKRYTNEDGSRYIRIEHNPTLRSISDSNDLYIYVCRNTYHIAAMCFLAMRRSSCAVQISTRKAIPQPF